MNLPSASMTRRNLLRGGLAFGAAMYYLPGAYAEELSRTPRLTEGPFYPDKLPLDKDNDLVIVGNSITPAVGQITHLTGRVVDAGGKPIKDATLEIWQVDHNGIYLNTHDRRNALRDQNFQGYGTFTTASNGEFRFRTIKPVPYGGRTAHIHLRVNRGGREVLTTQVFMRGFPQNSSDGVLRGLRNQADRELVLVDFKPLNDSKIRELSARFDIVIGITPSDSAGSHRG